MHCLELLGQVHHLVELEGLAHELGTQLHAVENKPAVLLVLGRPQSQHWSPTSKQSTQEATVHEITSHSTQLYMKYIPPNETWL